MISSLDYVNTNTVLCHSTIRYTIPRFNTSRIIEGHLYQYDSPSTVHDTAYSSFTSYSISPQALAPLLSRSLTLKSPFMRTASLLRSPNSLCVYIVNREMESYYGCTVITYHCQCETPLTPLSQVYSLNQKHDITLQSITQSDNKHKHRCTIGSLESLDLYDWPQATNTF